MKVLPERVNQNLKEFALARLKAEIKGERNFNCPVCSGRAEWRRNAVGRMRCRCHRCGMYLEGGKE